MNSMHWPFREDGPSSARTPSAVADFRAQIARDEEVRREVRQLAIATQRSDMKSTAERIQAWEKLRALRLPADPEHPILFAIVHATGLTLAEVLDEQRSRLSRGEPESRK